jgi:hypothetical protein
MEPQNVPEVLITDIWRPKDGGMSWRIVSVTEGSVGLAGPGPCRTYKTMSLKTLLDNWVKVTER